MSRVRIIFVFLVVFVFGCSESKYKINTNTDSNGYSYQTVTNDPLNVRIYTLDNGLKIYLSVNHNEPRIQTYIAVKAGSAQTDVERSGLSHYLEHLMFKGTSKMGTLDWEKESVELDKIAELYDIRKNELDTNKRKYLYRKIDSISFLASKYAIANEYVKLAKTIGAKNINALSAEEKTVFLSNIPSNELEKWCYIESERFSELVLRLFHTEIEAVFEEYNMMQNRGNYKVWNNLFAMLFPNHPYGTQPILGKVDHIQNPTFSAVHDFFKKYYVPNNMAICMSGDIDFENTIKTIDKYFGKLKSVEIKANKPVSLAPITKPIDANVYGSGKEYVAFAYRFDNKKTKCSDCITIIDLILNNMSAGLIDLNLVQKQKVFEALSEVTSLRDFDIHYFAGTPITGQSLEEVKSLILMEIEKIKKGEFDDWLIKAIVNDLKVSALQEYQSNNRALNFVDAFISDISWQDVVSRFDRMNELTKEDIVKFANKNYNNNYVVVYKRSGVDSTIVKVKKPLITPININSTGESAFYKKVSEMNSEQINPVFVDFKKQVQTCELDNKTKLSYIVNDNNELFKLYFIVDAGSDNDKELALAISYLKFIGTDKYKAEQLQQEYFKHGLWFNVDVDRDRAYIEISGLKKSLEKGIQLLKHTLSSAIYDKKSYADFVNNVIQTRENLKNDQGTILWQGLYNYALFGKDNPMTNVMSKDELMALNPDVLIEQINKLEKYPHQFFYYGNDDLNTVKSFLNKSFNTAQTIYPKTEKEFIELKPTKNRVFFVHFDAVQTKLAMISVVDKYNELLTPTVEVFNEYYGSGMGSVVYQEIRESKALAYYSYANYLQSKKANKPDVFSAYIATQSDKLSASISAMNKLLTKMPMRQNTFQLAKESVRKKIQTSRITGEKIFWQRLLNNQRGTDFDTRQQVYNQVKDYSLNDVEQFFNQNIKNNFYTYLIVGDRNSINITDLQKLGEVVELTCDDIFNY